MVGAGFWTGILTVAGSSLVATLVREATLAIVRPLAVPPAAELAADYGGFPLVVDTCPAECPAPSLAFCAGPALDVAEAFLDSALTLACDLRWWLLGAGLALSLVGAFWLGRVTAPRAVPALQPHVVRGPAADRQQRLERALAVGRPGASDR